MLGSEKLASYRRISRRQRESGCGAAQVLAEPVEGFQAALLRGAPDRHQDRLGAGPRLGAVAAPDLAQQDAETHGVFGAPVTGVDAGDLQERPQLVAVVVEVF